MPRYSDALESCESSRASRLSRLTSAESASMNMQRRKDSGVVLPSASSSLPWHINADSITSAYQSNDNEADVVLLDNDDLLDKQSMRAQNRMNGMPHETVIQSCPDSLTQRPICEANTCSIPPARVQHASDDTWNKLALEPNVNATSTTSELEEEDILRLLGVHSGSDMAMWCMDVHPQLRRVVVRCANTGASSSSSVLAAPLARHKSNALPLSSEALRCDNSCSTDSTCNRALARNSHQDRPIALDSTSSPAPQQASPPHVYDRVGRSLSPLEIPLLHERRSARGTLHTPVRVTPLPSAMSRANKAAKPESATSADGTDHSAAGKVCPVRHAVTASNTRLAAKSISEANSFGASSLSASPRRDVATMHKTNTLHDGIGNDGDAQDTYNRHDATSSTAHQNTVKNSSSSNIHAEKVTIDEHVVRSVETMDKRAIEQAFAQTAYSVTAKDNWDGKTSDREYSDTYGHRRFVSTGAPDLPSYGEHNRLQAGTVIPVHSPPAQEATPANNSGRIDSARGAPSLPALRRVSPQPQLEAHALSSWLTASLPTSMDACTQPARTTAEEEGGRAASHAIRNTPTSVTHMQTPLSSLSSDGTCARPSVRVAPIRHKDDGHTSPCAHDSIAEHGGRNNSRHKNNNPARSFRTYSTTTNKSSNNKEANDHDDTRHSGHTFKLLSEPVCAASATAAAGQPDRVRKNRKIAAATTSSSSMTTTATAWNQRHRHDMDERDKRSDRSHLPSPAESHGLTQTPSSNDKMMPYNDRNRNKSRYVRNDTSNNTIKLSAMHSQVSSPIAPEAHPTRRDQRSAPAPSLKPLTPPRTRGGNNSRGERWIALHNCSQQPTSMHTNHNDALSPSAALVLPVQKRRGTPDRHANLSGPVSATNSAGPHALLHTCSNEFGDRINNRINVSNNNNSLYLNDVVHINNIDETSDGVDTLTTMAAHAHVVSDNDVSSETALADSSKPASVSPVMVISLGPVMALRQKMFGGRQAVGTAAPAVITAAPPLSKPNVLSQVPMPGAHAGGESVASATSSAHLLNSRPTSCLKAKRLPPITQ